MGAKAPDTLLIQEFHSSVSYGTTWITPERDPSVWGLVPVPDDINMVCLNNFW